MQMTPSQWIVLTGTFALGCAVGSFLNVVIWRVPLGLRVNEPRRSFCPQCRSWIRWHDNIPVLSFLLLRGHCRDCDAPISWRYPLVELITGLLFALVYYRQGVQAGTGAGVLVIMMLVTALLIVASGIDIDWLIIPDEISLGGILGGLLAGLLLPQLHVGPEPYHTFSGATAHPHLMGLAGSGVGALVGGGTVLACAVVGFLIFQREAMGIGDAKLMAMMGAFLGWKVAVISFFLAPFIGLLYGIPLLLMDDEHVMPYGPFLSIAGLLAIIFRTSMTLRLEPLDALGEILFG
jgi:leader peptidase (prepilin peptidase)/N-methyltransferase